jgi:uncharacterized membrane protein YbhN (UPF0104 family)
MRALAVFTVALVASFIVWRHVQMAGGLDSLPPVDRAWLMALGFAISVLPPVINGVLWWELLSRLDKSRLRAIDSVAAFCAAWPGRYVPSSLPYLAGKFALGRRIGHSKRALASVMLYEHVLLVALGSATAALIIPIALGGQSRWMLVLAALGGVGGLLLVSPRVLHWAANAAARVARRDPIPKEYVLSYGEMTLAVALALLALLLHGAGFALVLGSFVELEWSELVAAGAIFNLAAAAGIAAVPVPSGIGVREAILIGLLQVFVPIDIATAAAVVMRFGGVLIDVAIGVIGAAVYGMRQRSTRAGAEAPLPPQRQLDAA